MAGYLAGEYEITKTAGGASVLGQRLAGRTFHDFHMEIDARLTDPTSNALVCLTFCQAQDETYYAFVVDPNDGGYLLPRVQGQSWTTVIEWTQHPKVARGTAWSRLGVRAAGSALAVLINGQTVRRVKDGVLREGEPGLGVGSRVNGPAQARFSNLLVTSLW